MPVPAARFAGRRRTWWDRPRGRLAHRQAEGALLVIRVVDLEVVGLLSLGYRERVGKPTGVRAVHVLEPADLAGLAVGAERFLDHARLTAAEVVGRRGGAVDLGQQLLAEFAC